MLAWAIDLDGVMWRGSEPVARSAEAVARLRAAGAPIAFVTNSSARTPAQVAAKLAEHGVPEAEPLVITSAMAAATLLEPGWRVLVVGGDGICAAVAGRGATVVSPNASDRGDRVGGHGGSSGGGGAVDAVIIGITDRFDYAALTSAMRAIRAGARFIATNDDATFPTAGGRLLPGNGALVAAVAVAAGVEPIIAGKPHRPAAALVREQLGASGVMVGDRPETDGLFAAALGYRFGLVLSGVTAAAELPVEPAPDLITADLATLVEQWAD